jgi:TRAP-type C4-dicarboxylate transport system substrate-binding protein
MFEEYIITQKIRFPLATVLLVIFIFFSCGDYTENVYIFNYCNSQPAQHSRSQSMIFFKKELEKRTNKRIQVENYFSAVLGTEFEVLDMVATGALQGTRSGGFTNVNKKYNIFMLPFLVKDWDEALKLRLNP